MLSVAQAQNRLLSGFTPTQAEIILSKDACGRVLAQEITAQYDLPRFSNSAVDGFAVRAEDVRAANRAAPARLQVVMDIPAGGRPERPLRAGEAARIMTGAPAPDGAELVIPVEETNFNFRQSGLPAPAQVEIYQAGTAGMNLRRAGEDLRQGEAVLGSGQRLRPQDIGLLSMLGFAQVTVHRRALVGVLSSGDELLPVGLPLGEGKIYDSNSVMLASLIQGDHCQVFPVGIAQDREDSIREHLDAAVEARADLILATAGVSVGAFDFVRQVVSQTGKLDFWQVDLRPGKPFAFGSYRDIPFFGLPGNPVSAFVGYELFVRPALYRLSGTELARIRVLATLEEPLTSDGRESYLRAVLTYASGWQARLTGHQGSGNLRSLVQANAFLIMPSGVKSLPAGAQIEAWLMEEP